MIKCLTIILTTFICLTTCFADTFVHKETGENFNGYPLQRKRGNRTLVRIKKTSSKYIDLDDYDISRNYLGRKKKVYIFSITNSVSLVSETKAFEKAIALASDQGPFFILIDIDSPGGRIDLIKQMCEAIEKAANCQTVAYISSENFGGALSEAAILALACDNVYMQIGSSIGAAYPSFKSTKAAKAIPRQFIQTTDPILLEEWKAYYQNMAQRKNRAVLLVKAMLDENVELLEFEEQGNKLLGTVDRKRPNQVVVGTFSAKGRALKLTSAEAVLYGIADKRVYSRQEVLTDLKAGDARQVRDVQLARARRKFEKLERRLSRIRLIIVEREERLAFLNQTVNAIENEIRQMNENVFREGFGGVKTKILYSQSPAIDMYRWENMLERRDQAAQQLEVVLGELLRLYRSALAIAQKHPDLVDDADDLIRSIDSAKSIYDRVRFRSYVVY